MRKILAFGASSSKNSINKKFAAYVANQIINAEVTLIDLNDYEMPLFSVDKEKENGVPDVAQRFLDLIKSHDAIVMSLAEHNGNYTAAFKNLIDWASRMEKKLFQEKPLFLLSTSPGGRGGLNSMNIGLHYLPFLGANILAHFSLPRFFDNFSGESGVSDPGLAKDFEEQMEKFTKYLKAEENFIKTA